MNESKWLPKTKRGKKDTNSVVFSVYTWLAIQISLGYQWPENIKKEGRLRCEIVGGRKVEIAGIGEKKKIHIQEDTIIT